ncbi:M15 family metallopeptidase [uncultured Pontibacter sp.]|uniref:M15 family metallopeptidase n=1 Tax=uncultured Pontibacter sp. TaxID=453356 RepID=UPI00262D0EBE|nr:M15 family metallopeptidase [uncultured Pontibacter sp.]
MKVLRIGSRDDDVRKWQYFLIGQGYDPGIADGIFGEKTKAATIIFQLEHSLQPDGIVGNKTTGMAMTLGFGVLADDRTGILSAHWPPRPPFRPLLSHANRARVFGYFNYLPHPIPGNPENIRITDGWDRRHIIPVQVPQLIPVKGSATVYFHRFAADQLVQLWRDWERANLLHLVHTWEGAYVPRFIRGSRTVLSNHAFGTAFDINYAWNKLGTQPALVGQKGSVRQLVQIAHQNGFYWGGHFTRQDGMHFEVAWVG